MLQQVPSSEVLLRGEEVRINVASLHLSHGHLSQRGAGQQAGWSISYLCHRHDRRAWPQLIMDDRRDTGV